MGKKILTVIFSIFWLGTLAQCGDSNALSKDIKFILVPDDPIIVNADLTLNPGTDAEFVAKAPWFIFSSRIENNSTNRLYLVTLTFKGTGTKNGGPIKVDTAIDPSVTCNVEGFGRAYLAILDNGQTYTRLTDPCDPETATAASPIRYEQWYIHSLPASDNSSYSIDVNGEGWFVDAEEVPVERLTMQNYLLTQ